MLPLSCLQREHKMPSTIDTQQQADEWAAERLISKIEGFCHRHGITHMIKPRILKPLNLPDLHLMGIEELEIVISHLQLLTLYPSEAK